MLITRTSMVSGVTRTKDLDITQEQVDARNRGELIQNAFPNLSAADREFYMTGITDEEWQGLFGEEETD